MFREDSNISTPINSDVADLAVLNGERLISHAENTDAFLPGAMQDYKIGRILDLQQETADVKVECTDADHFFEIQVYGCCDSCGEFLLP